MENAMSQNKLNKNKPHEVTEHIRHIEYRLHLNFYQYIFHSHSISLFLSFELITFYITRNKITINSSHFLT